MIYKEIISIIIIKFSHIYFITWTFLQLSMAELTYLFNGLYTLLSKGWSLWEQWGGKDNKTTLCFLQKSIPWMDKCEAWLSRRRIILAFGDAQVCLIKYRRNTMKSSSCIHPDRLTVPMQPVGPPFIMKGWNFYLGKMNW